MSRPKVFVTRRIPDAGLRRIEAACDADVWEGDLPPPYDTVLFDTAGRLAIDEELMAELRTVREAVRPRQELDVPVARAFHSGR